MENPILTLWQQIWKLRAGDPALFLLDGTVARTFEAIEQESLSLVELLPEAGTLGIQLGNHPQWPALLLAAWRKGLAVLLADRDFSAHEEMGRLCGVTMWWDGEGSKSGHEILGSRNATDLYKLTSGTTAAARAVRFTAAQLLADCENICDTMGIGEDDVNCGAVSFAHSYGFSNLITPLICRGVPMIVVDDVLALMGGIERTNATVLPLVPTLYRSLLGVRALSPAVRLCLSAGAPLPLKIASEFHEKFGHKIHGFYGASECGGICYDATECLPKNEGFVGTPLRGVSLKLVTPGNPAGSRLCVQSTAVSQGYLPADQGGDLITGEFSPSDLVVEDEGFRIVGRESDILNVAGKKTHPATIETVLLGIEGVRDVVVFGILSATRGEEIHACVCGEDGLDASEIKRECAKRLQAWQVPRHIHLVAEIPTTGRGKISRRELARKYENAGTA